MPKSEPGREQSLWSFAGAHGIYMLMPAWIFKAALTNPQGSARLHSFKAEGIYMLMSAWTYKAALTYAHGSVRLHYFQQTN